MTQQDRRKHPRVSLKTSVALFDRTPTDGDGQTRPRSLGRFEILDLSVRGALLDGDVGVPVGTSVGVHLELPGTHVQVAGTVVRRDSAGDRPSSALHFHLVPPRDDGVLERAVAAVLDELRRRNGGGAPAR